MESRQRTAKQAESKKYNSINTYITDESYRKIRDIAFDESISMSCYVIRLIKSFFKRIDGDYNECLRQLSRFKDRFQVHTVKIKNRRKIGVVLSDDLYNMLKEFSSENNITMSEIMRVLVEESLIDAMNCSVDTYNHKNERFVSSNNTFEMYIDLG